MAAGAVIARIISQYSDKGSKAAQKDINKLGKNFDAFAKKAGKAFAVAGAAAVAFAGKLAKDSVEAAIEDQKSQALLANSLRNTVGATDEAIAAIEGYIDRMQRALGVADTELRPALAKLAGITGDLSQAQGLLSLALDLSAGATVSLDSAVSAIQKAYQGNFKALRNMGVKIDEATMKSKDFGKVLDILGKQFKGSAEVRAATFEFRMKRLGIAFDEAKETLGNALLPTVTQFFNLLTQKVIPAVQKWMEENGDKLVAAFQKGIKAVIGFGFVVFKVAKFIIENRKVFIGLGVILAGIFVAGKVMAFIKIIQDLVKVFRLLRAAALGAAAAEAAATGGLSVAAAAAGVAAFGVTVVAALVTLKLLNDKFSESEKSTSKLDFSFDGLTGTTEDFTKSLKGLDVNLGKVGINTKNLTKEQKTLLALQLAIQKLGGRAPTTETDPNQLEAARLNLIKQGAVEEQARFERFVKARQFEIETNEKAAESARRYADILIALGDAKITPAEFELLAAKWGITTNAAQLYVQTIISLADKTVSGANVAALAEKWGVTYEQASKYLDFFAALNDGTLSDAEINNLIEKWGFTRAEVIKYADAFKAAADGKIDLAEITNLAKEWGTTKEAAEAYVAKILEEFGFEETNLDGPISISEAWIAAYGDADIYKMLVESTFEYDPSITSGPNAAAGAWNTATAAAKAYADAANAKIETPTPPSAPKGNSGGFGSSLPDYLKEQIPLEFMAKGGIVNSPTLAMIGEGNGPEAVIPLSKMGSMGSTTINVTVQGSVTSERDLTTMLRNALLMDQSNGSSITYSSAL